jgi:hypothetical protein
MYVIKFLKLGQLAQKWLSLHCRHKQQLGKLASGAGDSLQLQPQRCEALLEHVLTFTVI